MKHKSKLTLWLEYNPEYIRIRTTPALRRRMSHDPGVKFMERGWMIVGLILAIMSILGRLLH